MRYGLVKPRVGIPLDYANPLVRGCVAFYPFNEGMSTVANNLIQPRLPATLRSGVGTWGGSKGGGVLTSGTTGSASVAADISQQVPAPFSVVVRGCWNALDTTNNTAVASVANTAQTTGWNIYQNGSSFPQLSIGLASGEVFTNAFNGGVAIVAGHLDDYAFTYDGTTLKLYFNGKLLDTSTHASTMVYTSANMYFGGSVLGVTHTSTSTSVEFIGLWNRILSLEEIKRLSAAPYQVFKTPSLNVFKPAPIPPTFDYPNPTLSLWRDYYTFTNAVQTKLIGKDTFYRGFGDAPAFDYPNPRLDPWRDYYTFLKSVSIQLIGKDLFYRGFGDGPANYDWPNPPGPPWRDDYSFTQAADLRFIGLDKFFGGFGQPPPNRDWPNPPGPSWRDDYSFINATQIQLIGQDTFFAGHGERINYDWPNPWGPIPPIDIRTWTAGPLPELFKQDQFFYGPGRGPVYDYPNPRGPIPAIDLVTWTVGLRLELLGKDTFFYGNQGPVYDYPNPRGAIPGISLSVWSQSLVTFIGPRQDTFPKEIRPRPGITKPTSYYRAKWAPRINRWRQIESGTQVPPPPPPPPPAVAAATVTGELKPRPILRRSPGFRQLWQPGLASRTVGPVTFVDIIALRDTAHHAVWRLRRRAPRRRPQHHVPATPLLVPFQNPKQSALPLHFRRVKRVLQRVRRPPTVRLAAPGPALPPHARRMPWITTRKPRSKRLPPVWRGPARLRAALAGQPVLAPQPLRSARMRWAQRPNLWRKPPRRRVRRLLAVPLIPVPVVVGNVPTAIHPQKILLGSWRRWTKKRRGGMQWHRLAARFIADAPTPATTRTATTSADSVVLRLQAQRQSRLDAFVASSAPTPQDRDATVINQNIR